MNRSLRTAFTLAVLTVGACAHSFAQGGCDTSGGACAPAPEIDPSLIGAGSVVLIGAVALIRRNRQQK